MLDPWQTYGQFESYTKMPEDHGINHGDCSGNLE